MGPAHAPQHRRARDRARAHRRRRDGPDGSRRRGWTPRRFGRRRRPRPPRRPRIQRLAQRRARQASAQQVRGHGAPVPGADSRGAVRVRRARAIVSTAGIARAARARRRLGAFDEKPRRVTFQPELRGVLGAVDERRRSTGRRRARARRRRERPVPPRPITGGRFSANQRLIAQFGRTKHLLRPQVPAAVDAKGVGGGVPAPDRGSRSTTSSSARRARTRRLEARYSRRPRRPRGRGPGPTRAQAGAGAAPRSRAPARTLGVVV